MGIALFSRIAVDLAQILLPGGVSNRVSTSLNLSWVLTHPLLSVVILLVVLLLVQGLLSLLSNLIGQLLLQVFKAPYKLVQWLLSTTFRPFKKSAEPNLNPSKWVQADVQERLTKVLTKLEASRREQDQLLQELKTIITHSERGEGREVNTASNQNNSPAMGKKEAHIIKTTLGG